MFWLFIKSNWKFLFGVAVAVAFAYFVGSYQERGTIITTLKNTVARLDSLITRKDDTLAIERARVGRLQADTARLNRSLLVTQNENLKLYGQLNAGERAALLADEAIAAGKAKVNGLVNSMSALQKKQAADAGLAAENLSYYGAGLSVSDTATTSRIAKLTAYGKVYHDSTQALKKTVGAQAERIRQQDGKIADQSGQISDLENVLNGVRVNVQDDFIASQKEKHPFGFGQKKSKERLRQKVMGRLPVKTTY